MANTLKHNRPEYKAAQAAKLDKVLNKIQASLEAKVEPPKVNANATNNKLDTLHFNWRHVDGYNRTFNACISERESGKSVATWMKIYNMFMRNGRPSIVLRRRIADISATYIDDIAELLNKFIDKPVQMLYFKGDLSAGIADVKLGDRDAHYTPAEMKALPTFFRIIGLSTPMNRIKSLVLKNVGIMFMDEFICNLQGGEKYFPSEAFCIKEIYTTYNREAVTPIRCYFCGNPYSVYCALFTWWEVDTTKLKPGAFIVGDDYVIDCFVIPPELKARILEANPLYQFDEAYKRYAFNGEAINDANIRQHKSEPKGAKMQWIFKMGNDFLSIHRVPNNKTFSYWCCKHTRDWLEKIGKHRRITVFDFNDMCEQAYLIDYSRDTYSGFKDAMAKNRIASNCVDAYYMAQDVYAVTR